MPLKKVKTGSNMYQKWISHTHSFLGGECKNFCKYCYVNNPRFGRSARYCGDIRLIEKEFNVNYGEGKTIFIEHMNDLFAKNVPHEFIVRILEHCKKWLENIYVYQTKNPARYLDYLDVIPANSILGTTIETNRDIQEISVAPSPYERYVAMKDLNNFRKFVTIEPVLDFDVDILAKWIIDVNPEFLNIGADSKGHNLTEPSYSKIFALIAELKKNNIEVREKHNMQRLIDKEKGAKQ